MGVEQREGSGLFPPHLHAEGLDVAPAFPTPAQRRACNLDGKPPNRRSDCSGLPARPWLPACRLLNRRRSWQKPRHQTELQTSQLQDHWIQPTTFPFLKSDLPTQASRPGRDTGDAHTPLGLRASSALRPQPELVSLLMRCPSLCSLVPGSPYMWWEKQQSHLSYLMLPSSRLAVPALLHRHHGAPC